MLFSVLSFEFILLVCWVAFFVDIFTYCISLVVVVVVVVLLFYVHGKHPRSCRDGQLT